MYYLFYELGRFWGRRGAKGLQKGGNRGPEGGPRGVREGSEFSELSFSGPDSCKN